MFLKWSQIWSQMTSQNDMRKLVLVDRSLIFVEYFVFPRKEAWSLYIKKIRGIVMLLGLPLGGLSQSNLDLDKNGLSQFDRILDPYLRWHSKLLHLLQTTRLQRSHKTNNSPLLLLEKARRAKNSIIVRKKGYFEIIRIV